MSPVIPILAGLLGVTALTWFCANHHRSEIEVDLALRSQEVLRELGLPLVRASADGQIVILEGEAPNEAARRNATERVNDLFGVERVRNLMGLQPAVISAPPQIERAEPAAPPQSTSSKDQAARAREEAETCQSTFNNLLAGDSVRFAPGSATIESSSFPLLNQIVSASRQCPAARIEVGGHTDSLGSLEVNLQISRARADSVAEYLRDHGLDPRRLSAVGYGSTRPVADNATEEGRRLNRRTELKVQGL